MANRHPLVNDAGVLKEMPSGDKVPAADLASMSGASSGSAGAAGIVPQPAAGQQNKFLRGDATYALSQSVNVLTDASTISVDASISNRHRVTLGGNRTLGNPTNAVDGQQLVFEIIQDGTGSRTLTLDTKFALGTDITAVTLTTTASKRDFLTVYYNSTADKFYVVGFIKGF
jgi:hypothetical protein